MNNKETLVGIRIDRGLLGLISFLHYSKIVKGIVNKTLILLFIKIEYLKYIFFTKIHPPPLRNNSHKMKYRDGCN